MWLDGGGGGAACVSAGLGGALDALATGVEG